MDGYHPKRRKDKYNPYTINTTEDGLHWLSFTDGQGTPYRFQIDSEFFNLLDSFELDDVSYFNELDRHIEHSELTEASLYDRAVNRPETVEETVMRSIQHEALHKAIEQLPDKQRDRLIQYYFSGLTYEQIAEKESCSQVAVKYSIDKAIKALKNLLK